MKTMDLSDAMLAAGKRLGVTNLYAIMGSPVRVGFLTPNADPKVGNDLDKIFEHEDWREVVKFIEGYSFPPEYADDDHEGPRTEFYGRLVIAEDWDGNEVGRGELTEINCPFDYKLGDTWWTISDSYNLDFMSTPLRLIGAWKPEKE